MLDFSELMFFGQRTENPCVGAVYSERDDRLAGMTDEDVEMFYSCALCQSFAPNHICVVSPERPGLCGAYSWLDCRAAYEITPSGPNQPISKGNCIETAVGQWDKVNAFVLQGSHQPETKEIL